MLDVFSQRMPDYYEQKFKKSLKMQLQTLVHGDFHGGNHMYGMDENHGNTDFKEFRDGVKLPYARHYNPRLVNIFTPFPKTIYVL